MAISKVGRGIQALEASLTPLQPSHSSYWALRAYRPSWQHAGQPEIAQAFAHIQKRALTDQLSSASHAWVGLEKPQGFSWAGMLGVLWHKQALPTLQGQHSLALNSQAGGGRAAGSSVQRGSSRRAWLVRAFSSLCSNESSNLSKSCEDKWSKDYIRASYYSIEGHIHHTAFQ